MISKPKNKASTKMTIGAFDALVASGASTETIVRAIPLVDSNVTTFYARWPDLFQYFDQQREAPIRWVEFLLQYPEMRAHVDFGRFNALAWLDILVQNPRFIYYAKRHLGTLEERLSKDAITMIADRHPMLLHREVFAQAAKAVGLDVGARLRAAGEPEEHIRAYPILTRVLHTYRPPPVVAPIVVVKRRKTLSFPA